MSDFDEFVDEDGETSAGHQPKAPKGRSNKSKDASVSPDGPMDTSQTVDVEQNDSRDESETIADSRPLSWEREQFAMFLQQSEVYGYEDLMHDAKGQLKHNYNVRNDKRYEIDQAFIELALERIHPGDIAVRLIENRGIEPQKNGADPDR
ncbi:hypothetical protein [Halocatena pleomorpha]|uniref:Uncharacterized protein n=1 Tax=Halocatena pleomorpha TaxID=1785090 RepID=A0A3P3RD67_9EURY|nr:hypothetical protein [Halocatena pleomorpha]RRJ31432.1 hypothetical protein EIK79_06865 [Halocatena pleomorpha]